ncbi:GNAT family N-acetyltransferase [Streptacidiphilus melanogenes]|uniref:GNAT family N-acetyltransferase n=1 Tax=Streptacidiphilus melanogenes TaxID=411235 RepID=UPI0005AB6724|nr:GNAT family N-acetyltransferase [Streptacidiphilus melanogenes]
MSPDSLPSLTTVTVWHLEQGALSALPAEPVPAPAGRGLAVVRAELIGPEFARFLYTAVGGVWHWTDRLEWTHADWEKWLAVPGTETWVAWVSGTPAGYVQLAPREEGVVEVVYFGLLPAFIGRGLGGHLLDLGLRRAWDLADRHPSLPTTRKVVVETCSLDGPAALHNYRSRGFTLARTETVEKPVGEPPGPWPGSGYGHTAPTTA